MPITYHPAVREVLWCQFDGVEPEMVKRRTVVVISPKSVQRARLVTVVPLSTTPPDPMHPWHCQLEKDPLPHASGATVYAKCDMVAVVCFDRLHGFYKRWNGQRKYSPVFISLNELRAIRRGLLFGLGLGALTPHLPDG